ncbi:Low-density lipoprotein (LDL) receptor class A repeat [Trinorchestia longiramus]|nr:Low-density lipoprotein (LDL) receptor class A repeat [Trinorchestia longiramus]
MKTTSVLCAVALPLLLLLVGSEAQRVEVSEMDPDFYCAGRGRNELFRKELPEDISEEESRSSCAWYYRCVPGGGSRLLVSKSKCGFGMLFDVEQQTCQVRNKVNNCAMWEKAQKPKPKWPVPYDADNKCNGEIEIECGSGECLSKSLFCDGTEDCTDGSDENICSDPTTDPNAAETCNTKTCIWEEGCFCSTDGSRIPADLPVVETPQMITITFTGSVNEESFKVYQEIFGKGIKNKGTDCTPKATFFVSHVYTNYSAVQELHRLGHEIAVSSITNNPDGRYWSTLSAEEYEAEFDGGRLIAETFANISQGDIVGMRVPLGRVGGNSQFQMMTDWGFYYDSSLAAPRRPFPLWPYTLQHRMPHQCIGTDQNCPTRNFTVWEMVVNELDRRDDPLYSEALTGCHYIDQCANIASPKQFRAFLESNLQRHYATNRAPLGLHFTSSYFLTRKNFLREFTKWIADVASRGDYFFVNMIQAINWMAAPTKITAINNFEDWKIKCEPTGQPYCSLPNPCARKPPRPLASEGEMYLHTCMDCPQEYPWIYDPFGDRSGIFDL